MPDVEGVLSYTGIMQSVRLADSEADHCCASMPLNVVAQRCTSPGKRAET